MITIIINIINHYVLVITCYQCYYHNKKYQCVQLYTIHYYHYYPLE
jgi:hypothetical protein